MSDKVIEPISDNLKNNTNSSETTASPSVPQQAASAGQAATPPPQQLAQNPVAGSSPAPEPTSQPGDAAPQPFTMDSPAQSTARPVNEQAATTDTAGPEPFVMDGAQNSRAPTASPANQQTQSFGDTQAASNSANGLTAANNSAPQVIGPQQSAAPASSDQAPPVDTPQTVNQNQASPAPMSSAQSAPPTLIAPAGQQPQAPAIPTSQLNADGTPTNSAQSNSFSASDNGSKNLFSNKKTVAVVAAVVGLVGVLGFVFGYYIPNRPENVYSTGLERTGAALTELTSRATEAENIEVLSRMEMSGDLVFTSDEMTIEGDFNSKFEEGKSESSINLSIEGEVADDSMSIGGDLITDIAEDNQFPDVFFRVRGFEALGADGFFPGLLELENEWIYIDAADIAESLKDEDLDEDAFDSVNAEDVAEATDAIMGVVNEYVFTAGDKAVFVLDEIAGEDEFGDIRTYRYDVSINEGNARAFCFEASETFINTALYSKLSDDTSDETIDEELSEIREFCNEIEYDPEEYDTTLWIDRRTKLLHKIRVAEAEDPGSYSEIGQRYDGGDTFEFFTNSASSADNSSFSSLVITNFETNETTFSFEGDADDDFSSYSFTMNAQIQPMSESIEINRPSDAIPIEEAIEMIFGGAFSFEAEQEPVFDQTSSDDQVSDLIRESDARTLRTGIEAHYTIYDSIYPSLQQINDGAFRDERLSGIDEETFRDPDGSTSQLASSPAPGVYAYSPTPAGCDNRSTACTGYTLQVTMSNGQVEEWQNMQGSGFTQTMSRLLQ